MMMVVDSAWALFLRQQQQCFVCVYGARLAQDIAYRARGAQCASAAATRFQHTGQYPPQKARKLQSNMDYAIESQVSTGTKYTLIWIETW